MQTDPRITFHQMPASTALEATVREGIEELERIHERITSCRVVISAPNGHHRHGGAFDVRIDVQLPGDEIVVAGHGAAEKPEHADAHLAVRDAFRAARRQLESHVGRRRADKKAEAAGSGAG
jgi:ribosome-associated translation inhibitor RaiA